MSERICRAKVRVLEHDSKWVMRSGEVMDNLAKFLIVRGFDPVHGHLLAGETIGVRKRSFDAAYVGHGSWASLRSLLLLGCANVHASTRHGRIFDAQRWQVQLLLLVCNVGIMS